MPSNHRVTVPAELRLVVPESVELIAGDGAKLPRFAIVAYSGGAATPGGWPCPVVTDLSGARAHGRLPLLFNHNLDEVIGHVEKTSIGRDRIDVEGVVSGASARAQEITAAARNGFPWQVSIGALVHKAVFIDDGESVEVNGRKFAGPLAVVRQSTLREISFTPIGADPNTKASLTQTVGAYPVKYEQWLKQRGFDLAELSDAQNQTLRATFDAEQAATVDTGEPPADLDGDGEDDAPGDPMLRQTATLDLAQRREAEASEVERVAAIRRVAGDYPELAAKAIRQNWTAERAELEVLRASRPTYTPNHRGGGPGVDHRVIEAALRLATAEPEAALMAEYGAETMDAAYPMRRMGLRDLIQACCAMDGTAAPGIGASPRELAQVGFSTSSLSGILSGTANKSMLAAYRAVPSAARTVARKLTAADFKTHTGYRMTGDVTLKPIGQDGELKHGNAGEASFTYAVDTYGRIFGITRQMLKNDDLGAFYEIPRMIGRGAALALERAFWTLVLANTGSFFAAGNGNYISGATTTLTTTGLDSALVKMRKQVDANKEPILLLPRYLVVPPELETAANELYKSPYVVVAGDTDLVRPSANTYAGKYEPVVSPFLSATGFHTSVSAVGWYLFGDPADVAAFGIAYLDGVETPVVEEVDVAGDVLGTAWRGYHDFGVCQIDSRGAVKSKGAA